MTDDFALSKSAFQFWLKNYAGKVLDANEFTAGLQKYIGLSNDQKRTLTVSIHASLNRSIDQMLPVPETFLSYEPMAERSIPELNSHSSAKNASAKNSFTSVNSAHCSVTTYFLKTIVNEVRKLGQEAIIELQEVLIEDSLEIKKRHLAELIIEWAKGNFSHLELPKEISIPECSQTAHAVYLSVCEAVGPVKADVLLDKTITQLNELPEAAIFSPKKLL